MCITSGLTAAFFVACGDLNWRQSPVTTGLVKEDEFKKAGQSPGLIFPSVAEAAIWLRNGVNET